MPHLIIQYSRDLEDHVDMDALCAALRDAMVSTGIFPLGGIRVRGFRADAQAIADGARTYHFVDLVLRMGAGRAPADRARALRDIYGTARAFLEPRLPDPCALSMEVVEISAEFSEKSWNTIHTALRGT